SFSRKSRVQPKRIFITSAKRLFQQHRSFSDITALQQQSPVHPDQQTYQSVFSIPARNLEIGSANLSISAGVNYSRVLPTEQFTIVGGLRLTALEAMIIRHP